MVLKKRMVNFETLIANFETFIASGFFWQKITMIFRHHFHIFWYKIIMALIWSRQCLVSWEIAISQCWWFFPFFSSMHLTILYSGTVLCVLQWVIRKALCPKRCAWVIFPPVLHPQMAAPVQCELLHSFITTRAHALFFCVHASLGRDRLYLRQYLPPGKESVSVPLATA